MNCYFILATRLVREKREREERPCDPINIAGRRTMSVARDDKTRQDETRRDKKQKQKQPTISNLTTIPFSFKLRHLDTRHQNLLTFSFTTSFSVIGIPEESTDAAKIKVLFQNLQTKIRNTVGQCELPFKI